MVQSPISNSHLLSIQQENHINSSHISSLFRQRRDQIHEIRCSELLTEPQLDKLDSHLYDFFHLFDTLNYSISEQIGKRSLPTEHLAIIWNILILCNQIGICIYLPLKITLLLLIFLAVKSLDIIILLNSNYFEDGQIINDKQQIQNRYFSLFFFLDAIHLSTILILFIDFLNQYHLIKWILIFIVLTSNIRRVSHVIVQLRFRFNFWSVSQELTFNLFKVAIILHILNCLWLDTIYQFELEYEYGGSHSLNDSYLNSLVIVTQIVTFNSSYQPQWKGACMIYIAISIVSLYLLAFILHSCKQLFSTNKEIQELSQILDENKLSSTLKLKILSSLENKSQLKRKVQLQQTQIYKSLPDDLQSEIVMSQRFKILQQYFNTYEEQTIINMVNACEEMTCHPNTIIITQDIKDDQSIYFIIEGQLDVLINGQKTFLHRLNKGQVFGEISFISQCPRTATVKSYKSSQLLKLARDQFLKTLTQRDRQIYFSQIDSLLFDRNYPFSCFCCRKNTHHILECPVLNYRPSFNWILDKEKESPQKRYKFQREKQRQHFGSLRMANFFKENNEELLELYEENVSSVQDLTVQSTYPYEMTNPQNLGMNKINIEKQRREVTVKTDDQFDYFKEYSADNPSEIEFVTNVRREMAQRRTYNTAGFGTEDQTLQELPSLEDQCSILDYIKNKEQRQKPTIRFQSDHVQSASDLVVSSKNSYNSSNQNFNSSDSLKTPTVLSHIARQFSQKNPIKSLSRSRSRSRSISSKQVSSNFHAFQHDSVQEYYRDFEKIHSFEYFHPNYNYNTIIDKANFH